MNSLRSANRPATSCAEASPNPTPHVLGTLYHGTRFHFEDGFRLEPQPDGYTFEKDTVSFERLVEVRRPASLLSRFNSVYLTDDPELIDAAGGYTDAVYAVQPLSEPERSDLAWYSQAYCEYQSTPCDQEAMERLIDSYWAGIPYHTPAQSCFEYRVAAALVTSCVEVNVEPDENA